MFYPSKVQSANASDIVNIRYLEQDEFRAVLDVIEDKPKKFMPWFPLALRTYKATGARPAEIVGRNGRNRRTEEEGFAYASATQEHHGLRGSDLRGNHQVLIEGKNVDSGIKKGTGLKPRLVIVGDRAVYKELEERAEAMPAPTAHIFGLGPSKNTYDGYVKLREEFYKLRPLLPAALREFAPRWLRHSWAIHALRNGVDLVTIQRQLGHARLEITAIYLRFAPTDSSKVLSAFSAPKPVEPVVPANERVDCPSCGFAWERDPQGRLVLDSRVGVAMRRQHVRRHIQ